MAKKKVEPAAKPKKPAKPTKPAKPVKKHKHWKGGRGNKKLGRKPTKRPVGRPTDFTPEIANKILEMAGKAMTARLICLKLGIAESTFYLWKEKHPAFSEALKATQESLDEQVVSALLQRARGYRHEAVKFFQGKDGRIRVQHYTEIYPPDPTSMTFWLKNRKSLEWRDKREEGGGEKDEQTKVEIYLPKNGREAV